MEPKLWAWMAAIVTAFSIWMALQPVSDQLYVGLCWSYAAIGVVTMLVAVKKSLAKTRI